MKRKLEAMIMPSASIDVMKRSHQAQERCDANCFYQPLNDFELSQIVRPQCDRVLRHGR